jgi:hypothetical protein
MALEFEDSSTSRQNGTSHVVTINTTTAGSFEYVVALAEDDPGGFTAPSGSAGWELAWEEQYDKPSSDPGVLYVAVWHRTSDGDTAQVDVVTGNSLRVALLRASFTGSPDAASPLGPTERYEDDPLSNPVTNTDTDNLFVGQGTSFCLVIEADASWNQSGLGATMGQGPLDWDAYSVNHQRCVNYHAGVWLLDTDDDPFQFELNYFV